MTQSAKSVSIEVSAERYEAYDDCLTAAAEEYAAEHDCAGYDLDPRWVDGDEGPRESIALTVPAWTVAS